MSKQENQIKDPTSEGTKGIKGLKGVNSTPSNPEIDDMRSFLSNMENEIPKMDTSNLSDLRKNRINETSYIRQVGNQDFGESKYDKDITTESQLNDLNNSRGQLQPWYDQLGAGVAKMGVLAGTTFLDGTLGVVAGLGNVITGGDDSKSEFSDFWNNPISQALQSVNEWSETALPNYYTNEELKNDQNGEWYKNIFSSNFIGDKFLKNFGFAIGAAYSGMVYTGLLSEAMTLAKARTAFKTAATLGGDILKGEEAVAALRSGNAVAAGEAIISESATAAKQIKAAPWIMQTVGGVSGAMGEAKIEAIQNANDNMNMKKQLLDSNMEKLTMDSQREFEENIASHNPDLYYELGYDANGNIVKVLNQDAKNIINQKAQIKYNEALRQIAEDAKSVGNMDFILNMGVLSVSNMWQFGKVYAGGYATGKKFLGTVSKEIAKDAETGLEKEIVHDATGIAKYAYKAPTKLEKYAKLASNPLMEGNEEMMQQAAAFASGYKYNSHDTFNKLGINDKNSNESLNIIQAMGKGMLDTYGDSSQWEQFAIGALTGLIGVPMITKGVFGKNGYKKLMSGGIWNVAKGFNENVSEDKAKVDALNKRLSNPKYIELYKGLTRHQTLDNAMKESLENNDEFTFKNAEHQQMISDIITFHNTGRLQDFYDTIDTMANVKPEDVDQIKSQSVNKQTGKSIFDDVTSDQDVIDHVKKQATKLKEVADSYKKIYDNLSVTYGDKFNKDVMSEMIYKIANIDHLEKRFHEVFKDVKDKFTPYAEIFKDMSYTNEKGEKIPVLDVLNMSPVDFLHNATIDEEKLSKSTISARDSYNEQGSKVIRKEYGEKRGINKSLERLDRLKDLVLKHYEVFNSMPEFTTQLEDLSKLVKLRKDFIDDHILYTKHPNLLQDIIDTERDEEVKKSITKKSKELKQSLASSTTLADFKSAYDSIEDNKEKREALNSLIEDGHEVATKFKAFKDFRKEVLENINLNGNTTSEEKQHAIEIFNSRMNQSNSIDELADLNTLTADNVDEAIKVDEAGNIKYTDEDLTNNVLPIIYHAVKKTMSGKKFKNSIKTVPVVTKEEIDKMEEEEKSSKPITPPASSTQSKSTVSNVPSGGESTQQDALTSNNAVNKDLTNKEEALEKEDPKNNTLREWWNQAIQYFDINLKKAQQFVLNKNANPRYKSMIEILEKAGAFDYVNQGNLSIDDKVEFMIDNSLFSHLSVDEQALLANTIFMIKRDEDGGMHILGVLSGNQNNILKYKGLKSFRERVLKEFEEHQKKGDHTIFVSKESVKVSNILPGNIITTGNSFRTLKQIKGTDKGIILGIMQNGTIVSPKSGIEDLIVNPKDEGNREGRTYLLVKGGDGKYYPVLLAAKRFNSKEFNMNDPVIQNTKRYRNIMRGINRLAESTSVDDVTAARNIIDEELYMGDYSVDYATGGKLIIRRKQPGVKPVVISLYNNGFNPDATDTIDDIDSEKGVSIAKAPTPEEIKNNRRDVNDIAQEIIKYLQEHEAYIQISKSQINDSNGYNQNLIDDDLLYSNIESTEMQGAWFQTTYIDEDGVEKEATTPSKQVEIIKSETTISNGKESVIPGQIVKLNGSNYYIQDNGEILNDGGKPVLNMDAYTKSLLNDLSWIKKNNNDSNWKKLHYGEINITDKDGNIKPIKGFVTPSGRVIDITGNAPIYLSDSYAKQFVEGLKSKLLANKPTVSTQSSETIAPSTVIFNSYNGPYFDALGGSPKDKESLPSGIKDIKPGFYIHSTRGVVRTEIAPLAIIHGVQLYVAPDGNGGVRAVFPNGVTRGLANNVDNLLLAINKAPESIIIEEAEKPTVLTGNKSMSYKKVETSISTPIIKKQEPENKSIVYQNVERQDAIYVKDTVGKKINRTSTTKDSNSTMRIFNVNGTKAQFDFHGNVDFAVNNFNAVFDNIFDANLGNLNEVKKIFTIEPGEVQMIDGKWTIIKEAKVISDTMLNKINSKKEIVETKLIEQTPTKPKKELTPEQQAKLKAMAEREAKLKGKVSNNQQSKESEYSEQSKKLFPDKQNTNDNEKNSVKSLDNSNKKLIFAKLDKELQEAISNKFTESEWNNLTEEEQEKEIKCLKI